MFLNMVSRLNEQLLERLFSKRELSDEERLKLLISWFDSSIKRQPRADLEQAVCRLIKGIDGSVFSVNFVGSVYANKDSAFAESPICR